MKKGEITRLRILNATLEVIAQQGLRSTTHRAVAAQADVQLSLTTYYFRDIDDLIEHAFRLFCERSQSRYQEVWAEVFEYLDGFSPKELRKRATREEICDELSKVATEYITTQILDKPTGLAVEQTFFTTVRLSPQLRELARQHRANLLEPITRMCSRFNKQDPEIDAELIFDSLSRLEYEALLIAPEAISELPIARLVRRQIGWALGLRNA